LSIRTGVALRMAQQKTTLLSTYKGPWEDGYEVIEAQINAEGVHIWPFDLSFPVATRFFRWSGQKHIRMNRHEYLELLFVLSGGILWQIQDKYVTQHTGDMFVMGTTAYHRLADYLGDGVTRTATLYFLPEIISTGGDAAETNLYLAAFLQQDAHFQHVIPGVERLPSQVFEFVTLIDAELPAPAPHSQLAVKTYLKTILVLLGKYYSAHLRAVRIFERGQRRIQQMRPVFEFLEREYGRPVSVDDAAAIVSMSKTRFMRFFKQVTGETFITYLNRFRIVKAQALLVQTDKPVADVSLEVGFCDQSYFGMLFRRVTGRTPLEYRRDGT